MPISTLIITCGSSERKMLACDRGEATAHHKSRITGDSEVIPLAWLFDLLDRLVKGPSCPARKNNRRSTL
jgi:hypothetical protein